MGCQCSAGGRGARKSLSTQDLSRKVAMRRHRDAATWAPAAMRHRRLCEADGDASASVRAGGGAPSATGKRQPWQEPMQASPGHQPAEFMNRGTLRIRLDNFYL